MQTNTKTKIKASLLLLPLAIMCLLFLFAPMYWIIVHSFIVDDEWSLANYTKLFTSVFYRQAFTNSLWISFFSSSIALIIAVFFCVSLSKVKSVLGEKISAFINMISNFSGVPLSFAFIIIFGINGSLTILLKNIGLIDGFNVYSANGLLLIYIYFQIPLGILIFYPTLCSLNKSWEESAKLLGANKLQYWSHVVIPVILPGLLGTFIILMANAMGAYASAYALTASSYNLVTIRIANLVAGDVFLNPELASAMSIILVILLLIITVASQLLLKRYDYGKK